MEEADKEHEAAPGPSENEEDKNGVATSEDRKDPTGEGIEEFKHKSKMQEEEEILHASLRIKNLQKNLTTLVTSIQVAADAKDMEERSRMEHGYIFRQKQLENVAMARKERFEEITRGWLTVGEKLHFSELQRAQDNLQQLSAALVEDERKFIRGQQQEIRVKSDHDLKMLRRCEKEANLMLERVEEQFKNLSVAYREEVAQIQRVSEQENKLIKDKAKLEEHMKEHFGRQLEKVVERRKVVEESEDRVHNLMLESTNKKSVDQIEENVKSQVQLREQQQMKGSAVLQRLKQIRDLDKAQQIRAAQEKLKDERLSMLKKAKHLKAKHAEQKETLKKRSHFLFKGCKHLDKQNERMQKEVKHVAAADIHKFEETLLTMEDEVTQLADKALAIDFLICKQYLDLPWESPSAAFMESSGPVSSQERAVSPETSIASHCSRGMMDASVGPSLETDSGDGAGAEQGRLSSETLMKVMELLCDEMGFLVESKLQNMLPHLETSEQPAVKLHYLFSVLGLEDEDVPKLAEFLLNYEHQQRAQTEAEHSEVAAAVETSAAAHTASELVQPNCVLPALKSFLEQYRNQSSAHQHSSSGSPEASDTSVNDAYWNSMDNIICEDRLKLWDAAERKLNQYGEVLMEISEPDPETETLKEENTELRMELQQILSSTLEVELMNNHCGAPSCSFEK